jgi:hypothetical protein
VGLGRAVAYHRLAHLASNLLILLALLYDCRLICGENLTTLKTEGRGSTISTLNDRRKSARALSFVG